MDRRDALKALATVVGATGMTVTPVTTQDAQGVEVVILRVKDKISADTAMRIRAMWLAAVEGTALEHSRVVVLDDGIDVEVVRTK